MERLVLLCLLVAGTTAIEAKRKSEGEPGIMPLTPAARESLINKMKRIIDDAGIPYSFDEVAFRTDLMKTLLEVVEEKYSIPLRKKVHDFEHAIMQVPDHNPRGEEYNKALQKAENLYHAFIGHLRELARITFDVELMNLRMMAKNEVTNQMRLNLAKLKHIPYSFGGLIKKLSEDYYLGRELDLYVNDDVQGVLNALYKSPFDYVDAIKKLDEKLKGGHAKAKNIADALKKSIESAKGKSKKEKKEKKDKKD